MKEGLVEAGPGFEMEKGSKSCVKNSFGVVFDLDGLLVDSERVQALSFNAVLKPFGVYLDDEVFARLVGLPTRKNFEDLKRWYPSITATVEELLERKSLEYARLIPIEMRPMEGAVELVRSLWEKGVPMAVASSSPHEDIEMSLEAIGLERMIPVRVSGFDCPRMKPAPDVYLLAATRLGMEPSRCIAFEDAQAGVEAAAAAGMLVVAVPNRFTAGRHDFSKANTVISSLKDVCFRRLAEMFENGRLTRSC